jgi:hypothetical protein
MYLFKGRCTVRGWRAKDVFDFLSDLANMPKCDPMAYDCVSLMDGSDSKRAAEAPCGAPDAPPSCAQVRWKQFGDAAVINQASFEVGAHSFAA